MMIKLTLTDNTAADKTLVVNTDFIVAIHRDFDDETRVLTSDGSEWLVTETVEEIGVRWSVTAGAMLKYPLKEAATAAA